MLYLLSKYDFIYCNNQFCPTSYAQWNNRLHIPFGFKRFNW